MIDINKRKQETIALSHNLGLESRQTAILGEGNSSPSCHDGSFLVKASGSSLRSMREEYISQVSFSYISKLLEREQMSEQEIEDELKASLLDQTHKKPSVETFLHALCLTLV